MAIVRAVADRLDNDSGYRDKAWKAVQFALKLQAWRLGGSSSSSSSSSSSFLLDPARLEGTARTLSLARRTMSFAGALPGFFSLLDAVVFFRRGEKSLADLVSALADFVCSVTDEPTTLIKLGFLPDGILPAKWDQVANIAWLVSVVLALRRDVDRWSKARRAVDDAKADAEADPARLATDLQLASLALVKDLLDLVSALACVFGSGLPEPFDSSVGLATALLGLYRSHRSA